MSDPIWLARARSYLGLAEYPGAKTNPTIAGWLAKLKSAWRDDETAWCGTFVAECISEAGIDPVSGWAGARNWLNFGVKLASPVVGCIVVFWRDTPTSGKGHVGFVVGKDKTGNLMVLGGNQGDAVSIKSFSRGRILGYRWPPGVSVTTGQALPVLTSDGKLSSNEA
jgi:uncharacterized protein (TIGR02594 family)